jgi:hypothetical protein
VGGLLVVALFGLPLGLLAVAAVALLALALGLRVGLALRLGCRGDQETWVSVRSNNGMIPVLGGYRRSSLKELGHL